MSSHLVPNLWFNHNADEAVEFYTSAFPDSAVTGTFHYPTEDLPDFQKDMAGKILTLDFRLRGIPFLAINAGPEFSPTPANSFMVNFDPAVDDDAEAQLDALWAKLMDGGRALMPLDEYDFSKHYGWVEDRYGFSWQLMLTNPGGEPRPAIVPCLLFGGPQQNRAQEALEYYTTHLPGGHVGTVMRYTEPVGPTVPGSILFSEFQVLGQWLIAMDSGAEQAFTFSEAVSYSVACSDQAEIDALWDVLSQVPEFAQCGWCKDQFGVSWQVVPQNMSELLARPGAYQKLGEMKKLIIDEF